MVAKAGEGPVKRVLLTLGGVLGLVVVGLGLAVAEMFVGLRPLEDGYAIGSVRVVAPGIVAIGVVSSADEGVLLVDAGMDTAAEAILAELDRRGLGVDAVRGVLLTHGHGDHLGGLARFPAAEVVALEAEVPLIEGRVAPASPLGRVMPVAETGITVTRPVADGDTVTIGGVDIRVYAVPGHTAGSAAYLIDGVLFLGDSGQIARDGTIRPAPWLVTDDRTTNRASLAALARRLVAEGAAVAAIVPAHSGPAAGLGPLTDFAAGL